MLYDIALSMFIRIIQNNFVLYYHNVSRLVIKRLLKCDYMKCIKIMCTLFLSFLFSIDNEYSMLGVDHDKIILLSTPFPTIPMLGKNCCYNVIVFFVGNKRCCIVLYCNVWA